MPINFRRKLPVRENHGILVLGQNGSGKTSLIHKFFCGVLLYEDPVLDDTYHKEEKVDQAYCIIQTMEGPPSEEYTALRDLMISNHQEFLLVYSVFSRSSFDQIRFYYREIQRIKAQALVSICLVGSKCDVANEVREVTMDDGVQLAAELNIECFFETSAMDNINVQEAFHAIVRHNRAMRNGNSQLMTATPKTSGNGPQAAQPRHGRPLIWQRLLHYCRRSEAAGS